ncbi:hypothetical protein [Caulobacter sp. LARHSG274]
MLTFLPAAVAASRLANMAWPAGVLTLKTQSPFALAQAGRAPVLTPSWLNHTFPSAPAEIEDAMPGPWLDASAGEAIAKTAATIDAIPADLNCFRKTPLPADHAQDCNLAMVKVKLANDGGPSRQIKIGNSACSRTTPTAPGRMTAPKASRASNLLVAIASSRRHGQGEAPQPKVTIMRLVLAALICAAAATGAAPAKASDAALGYITYPYGTSNGAVMFNTDGARGAPPSC